MPGLRCGCGAARTSLDKLAAVHQRHHVVSDDHVGPNPFELSQGVFTVEGNRCLEALEREEKFQDFRLTVLIIDDQDLRHRASASR